MKRRDAKQAYDSQRTAAKARGIEWRFTFEMWLEWWGDDLPNRGQHPWNLQMQRFGDTGPYAPDNVRRGTPRQNAQTAANVARGRRAAEAAQALGQQRDRAPIAPMRDYADEDERELRTMFGVRAMSDWTS